MSLNNNTAEERKASRALLITMAVVVLVVAAIAIVGFLFMNRPDDLVEGQVEGTTVRVSGKLPGRVIEFFVEEGDTVAAGDTLVRIHSGVVEA
ncbi:MAG: biotin/lipoyl-binding protein, partial [Muribaculaceae bacterium]|nr:biotin/lipoyl-binding protein [Muribaculaceae bacterium]